MTLKLLNKLIIITISCIFCISEGSVWSQNLEKTKKNIIFKQLNQATHDTTKIRLLLELGTEYYTSDLNKAIKYIKQSLILSIKNNNQNGIENSLINLGVLYGSKGEFNKSIKLLKISLNLSLQEKDTTAIIHCYSHLGLFHTSLRNFDIAKKYLDKALYYSQTFDDIKSQALINYFISGLYYDQRNYNEAFIPLQKALNIYIETKDSVSYMHGLNNLASIYSETGQYQKAINIYKQIYEFQLLNGDIDYIAPVVINISTTNIKIGKYTEALKYAFVALDMAKRRADLHYIIAGYEQIGFSYEAMKNYIKALEYYLKVLEICKNNTLNKTVEIKTHYRVGLTYYNINEYDSSINYFTRFLDKTEKEQLSYNKIKAYYYISQSLNKKGLIHEAYNYLLLYNQLNDSLNNLNKKQELQEIVIKYDVEAKEKENKILQKDNELKNLYIKNQIKHKRVLIIAVIASIMFILLLYFLYKTKKKNNEILEIQKNKLRVINLELEDTIAAKDKLFSIISHDLKNPVLSIEIYNNMLMENIDKGDINEINKISKELKATSANLNNILQNLLVWAKSQRGLLKIKFEKFNLFNITQDVINEFCKDSETKEINIQNNIENTLTISSDINMIKIILRNIISNALKFTNKGGYVVVSAIINDNNNIIIEVKDSGVGMNEEQIDKLFGIGSIKSTNGTAGEKGTGLGLIICSDLIKTIGGKIWVKSIKNKGTSLNVCLNPQSLFI